MAVGMYPHGASPVEVLDMSGNVFEFCLNDFESPDRIDLTSDELRSARGGWGLARADSAAALQRRHPAARRTRAIGLWEHI